jgi:hypothetical protein
MKDADIAAVLTYVREHVGEQGHADHRRQRREVRAATASRTTPVDGGGAGGCEVTEVRRSGVGKKEDQRGSDSLKKAPGMSFFQGV